MSEQLVIVKDFECRPLLKKVVDANETVVFVTSEKAFNLIKNGNSDLFPIGFRSENVFLYEDQSLAGKIDWKQLSLWRASGNSN